MSGSFLCCMAPKRLSLDRAPINYPLYIQTGHISHEQQAIPPLPLFPKWGGGSLLERDERMGRCLANGTMLWNWPIEDN